MIWLKNHILLIAGSLGALLLALVGMQKTALKQAARTANLRASNAADAATATSAHEGAVQAIGRARTAQQVADAHKGAAQIAVNKALKDVPPNSKDEADLLNYLNRP